MLLSRNYYVKKWALGSAHRRLKNLTVVMEWVPSNAALQSKADDGSRQVHEGLTQSQRTRLRKLFDIFRSTNPELKYDAVQDLMRAADVDTVADKESLKRLVSEIATEGGDVSFDSLCEMFRFKPFYRYQSGRSFVALSLLEAESVRRTMHMRQGSDFVEGSDAAIALRVPDWSAYLDKTDAFTAPGPYQTLATDASFRYINSDTTFNERSLNFLLRYLQDNEMDQRERFFADLRSCRRREQTHLGRTSIARLLTTPDEYHLLESRSVIIRVASRLAAKGLRLFDAFRLFNVSQSGQMNCAEFYGSMEWLGLQLSPSQVHDIVRIIDADEDGFISWQEFHDAFQGDAGAIQLVNVGLDLDAVKIIPKKIRELYEDADAVKELEELPAMVARQFGATKVPAVDFGFNEVWTTAGCMSRSNASVWVPDLQQGFFGGGKSRVCLGHFVCEGFDNPAQYHKKITSAGPKVMQVAHKGLMAGGDSNFLRAAVEQFLPPPVRFKQIWNQQQGTVPFYAWQPVAPPNFVAMGCIGSNSPEPPRLDGVRCVPQAWVAETPVTPKCIWKDDGLGGQPGSLWVINSMQMLAVMCDHDPPPGPFYELAKDFFTLSFDDLAPPDFERVTAAKGFLEKRGPGGMTWWKKRYFELAGNNLSYWVTKDDYDRGAPAHKIFDIRHYSLDSRATLSVDLKTKHSFQLAMRPERIQALRRQRGNDFQLFSSDLDKISVINLAADDSGLFQYWTHGLAAIVTARDAELADSSRIQLKGITLVGNVARGGLEVSFAEQGPLGLQLKQVDEAIRREIGFSTLCGGAQPDSPASGIADVETHAGRLLVVACNGESLSGVLFPDVLRRIGTAGRPITLKLALPDSAEDAQSSEKRAKAEKPVELAPSAGRFLVKSRAAVRAGMSTASSRAAPFYLEVDTEVTCAQVVENRAQLVSGGWTSVAASDGRELLQRLSFAADDEKARQEAEGQAEAEASP